MGLPTGYLGGEQTEESHCRDSGAEDPPETGASTEAIRSIPMGCLIGEITKGSPELEEVQQGL